MKDRTIAADPATPAALKAPAARQTGEREERDTAWVGTGALDEGADARHPLARPAPGRCRGGQSGRGGAEASASPLLGPQRGHHAGRSSRSGRLSRDRLQQIPGSASISTGRCRVADAQTDDRGVRCHSRSNGEYAMRSPQDMVAAWHKAEEAVDDIGDARRSAEHAVEDVLDALRGLRHRDDRFWRLGRDTRKPSRRTGGGL